MKVGQVLGVEGRELVVRVVSQASHFYTKSRRLGTFRSEYIFISYIQFVEFSIAHDYG